MGTLNLDTFNATLKDQEPKTILGLYTAEMQSAMAMKISKMEEVIDDLNNGRPYHQNLQQVNNIDSNLDSLNEKIEKILEEHPELKKEMGQDDE